MKTVVDLFNSPFAQHSSDFALVVRHAGGLLASLGYYAWASRCPRVYELQTPYDPPQTLTGCVKCRETTRFSVTNIAVPADVSRSQLEVHEHFFRPFLLPISWGNPPSFRAVGSPNCTLIPVLRYMSISLITRCETFMVYFENWGAALFQRHI